MNEKDKFTEMAESVVESIENWFLWLHGVDSPEPEVEVKHKPGSKEVSFHATLPGRIHATTITDPDFLKDQEPRAISEKARTLIPTEAPTCSCPCGPCDRVPCVFEAKVIEARQRHEVIRYENVKWDAKLGRSVRVASRPLRGGEGFAIMQDEAPCPDCKGSGIYEGLDTREDCRACGGSGTV